MSRSKVLGLLLVVGLLAVSIPLAIALAASPAGTVTIGDSDDTNHSGMLSDKAMVMIMEPPALPEDMVYEGWLVSDDGSTKQSTGIMTVGDDGNITQTFMSMYTETDDPEGMTGPTGENLFAMFDKFLVTIEPVPDDDPGPSDMIAYSDNIPAEALPHIRHLLYSLEGNPAYMSGFHEGTPKGIAVGLREQTAIALAQARLSMNATTLADAHSYAEQVVNVIEGMTGANYGDLDGDGATENPGDGFGVLGYATDAALHSGLSQAGVADDMRIAMYGDEVAASANNVMDWATNARDVTMRALGSSDLLIAATLYMPTVESLLDKSLNGADGDGQGGAMQAYGAAQDMGTYEPVAAEVPMVGPKPPSVGDPNVPTMALVVLVVGALLAVSGIYIYRRSRQSALEK